MQRMLRSWFHGVLAATLALMIVVGVALRFVALDAVEFKGDEFNAFALAAAHLQYHSLPQVGLQSSTGLFNPPFFLVLLWPALLLKVDPIFATGWIVVLNAIGLFGLFLLLRRLHGNVLALAVTAGIATAPWLFIFSRKIWAQDVLFPFLILTSWLLLAYVRDRRSWQLVSAAISMALATQLHMSAWVLPLATILWMTILRIRPTWREILLAAALFLLLYAPYIAFHVHDHFQNLSRMTIQDAGGIFDHLYWLVGINGGVGLDYLWGPTRPDSIPALLLAATQTGTWLLGIAAAIGLVLWLSHVLHNSSYFRNPHSLSPLDHYVLLLLSVTLLSLLGYLFLGVPALPFYHLISLPLIPLLCGLALTMLPRRFYAPGTILLVLVAGVFLTQIVALLRIVTAHPEQLQGDYGVPYRSALGKWTPYVEAVQQGRMQLPGK